MGVGEHTEGDANICSGGSTVVVVDAETHTHVPSVDTGTEGHAHSQHRDRRAHTHTSTRAQNHAPFNVALTSSSSQARVAFARARLGRITMRACAKSVC